MQKEDTIEARDDAGGRYYRKERMMQEDIIEGRDDAEGGHYRREG